MTLQPCISLDQVAEVLSGLIATELQAGRKVLWLVSGGSSLPVAARVMDMLNGKRLENLYITLVDDKFLAPDDPASNASQFTALGFEPGAVQYWPILTGGSLEATTAQFEVLLEKLLAEVDVTIGQFGLGEGYHTGGILAHSPAAHEQSRLACGYEQDGIGHITVTPALIGRLDVAFINSMGEGKRPLVAHFLESEATVDDEPTQALKTARQVVVVSDVLPVNG